MDPGRYLLNHRAPDGLVAAALARRRRQRNLKRRAVALAAAFLLGVGFEAALNVYAPPPGVNPADRSEAGAAQAGADLVPVRLVYHEDGAHSVSVAGTWNQWSPDAQPLREAREGVFTVDLMLPRGRHEYMFVIDGERWVADPSSPLVRADGFGQENAVLEI